MSNEKNEVEEVYFVEEELVEGVEGEDDDEMISPVYRYKFTQNTIDLLHYFAKVHQYDDRKTFKVAWDEWAKENKATVEMEANRLFANHYDGDVLDKMFKSARYYFRKKSGVKKEASKRRTYVGVTDTLINAMNAHIIYGMSQRNYKPSDGFDAFCQDQIDLLQQEVNYLFKQGIEDSTEIMIKIKKTYKNRYFMLRTI